MAPDQSQGPDSGRPPIDPTGSAAPPPPPPGYGPPVYPSPPPRHSSGVWSKLLVSVIGFVLLGSLVANFYFGFIINMLTAGVHLSTYQAGDSQYPITILPIDGMVDGSMAQYVHDSIKLLDKNPPVALILRVDSGGGAVSASDQIWHDLDKFKKEHPKIPIVSSYGQIAASGAYYLSAGSNYIYAEPTTITGSIGVMAPLMTFAGLLNKVGIEPEWIVAKGSPDKTLANNPTRKWTDADRAEVRNLLDADYKRFVHVVIEGRSKSPMKMTLAELNKVDKGRVYTADQAKQSKLIDGIGYLGDAVKQAAKLAGVPATVRPQVNIIAQPASLGLLNLLGESRFDASQLSADKLRSLAEELTTPQLEYRALIK